MHTEGIKFIGWIKCIFVIYLFANCHALLTHAAWQKQTNSRQESESIRTYSI